VSTTPPPLAADIEAGLRRLRLSAMRTLSPELLVTAKTQRWKPEEFLRTLVEAEITSRDASNARNRLKVAAFPVTKTLDEFDIAASSVQKATFDYLSNLEWIRAKENLCLVGPAGTGKSHLLVALGYAAIEAGHRVRYFSAVELVETLYRGLADNSVGRVLEGILRADLILIDEIGFAPMDNTGCQPSRNSLTISSSNSLVRSAIHILVDVISFVRGRWSRSTLIWAARFSADGRPSSVATTTVCVPRRSCTDHTRPVGRSSAGVGSCSTSTSRGGGWCLGAVGRHVGAQ
jgi:DNA replication protein DnaC